MQENTVKQPQYAQVLDLHLMKGFSCLTCPLCSYQIWFQKENDTLSSSPITVKSLYSWIIFSNTLHSL